MTTFSSPVPVGSRFTSGFSTGRFLFGKTAPHAGADWAPPTPGLTVPIYAVAAGVVVGVGGPAANAVIPGHSGNVVVIDHGILTDANGSDHTRTNYGHLINFDVHKGQKVVAGQKIGMMGATGNVSGMHLHFGVTFNGKYADPKAWLARKGIVPGRTPPVCPDVPLSISPVSSVKPTLKPAGNTTAEKPVKVKYSAATATVQKNLSAMGYEIKVDGFAGPETIATIKRYQARQRSPYKLVEDGVWGAKTNAHYLWVKKLQAAMNMWRSTDGKSLRVDGSYKVETVARIMDLQTRNRNKAYKGAVDGIPGRVFCKMLGIVPHP